MDPIISPEELVREREHVALFDARSGKDIAQRFEERHLAGARHVHLERDLSLLTDDASRGGRHPLPPPEVFAATLGRLGIRPDAHVVIYDDKGGANAASRFWWMLHAIGHERVQVLDGGMQAAIDAGFPTERGAPTSAPVPPYPGVTAWPSERLLDADGYAALVANPAQLAIDVRAPSRFRGEEDAFDPNPGHVPGAINAFYETNLDASGRFLPAEQLAANYRALLGDRPPSALAIQCGSGVTACHTLLALERAGLRGARLYVGSFSEWTRQGRPVARGERAQGE